MKKIPIKKEIIIIIFGILLNFLASHYNLNKYDKIIKNYEGVSYNQIHGSDLLDTWEFAENFRKKFHKQITFLIHCLIMKDFIYHQSLLVFIII